MLEEYEIETTGASAVVLGRSAIVGKPMAQLLMAANATVTVLLQRARQEGPGEGGAAPGEGIYGITPEQGPDFIALRGDPSDGITGAPGVGEKTAAELVRRLGSLEGVFEWKSLVSGRKRRENLQAHEEQARLSKILATVRYDVPLEVPLADLERRAPNLPELIPLLRELEFAALEVAFTPPPEGVVEIYSDGSGTDSGPGGYGTILRYGEFEKELSGFEPVATSQRMELLAAIRGLEALNGPRTVRLFSDSQYLVRGMSEWIHGWTRSGRLETPGALANQDLWRQLVELAEGHEIVWKWVPGHAGHPFNERCDRLAKRAVDEGLQAAGLPGDPATEEEGLPSPVAAARPAPVAPREESEFDAEADGQLRLY